MCFKQIIALRKHVRRHNLNKAEGVVDKENIKFNLNFDSCGNEVYEHVESVPVVVTHDLFLNRVRKIVINRVWIFPIKPRLFFRSAKKLTTYLVRDKIRPIKRKVGSCFCNK